MVDLAGLHSTRVTPEVREAVHMALCIRLTISFLAAMRSDSREANVLKEAAIMTGQRCTVAAAGRQRHCQRSLFENRLG